MYSNLLLSAIRAALQAGDDILKIYDSDFSVEYKQDASPLTAADKNAHKRIAACLDPLGIPMLSEEGRDIPYAERKNWKQLWIVDPLDGTKEFVKRNGEFTVNIALIENLQTVLGVIYQPTTHLLYFAARGTGVYKLSNCKTEELSPASLEALCSNAEKLPVVYPSDTLRVLASRSHMNTETRNYIDSLSTAGKPVSLLNAGSSLKFCLIAEGKADLYPRFGPCNEWDTAAGQAIVECSGGQVLDFQSKLPIRYNREDILNKAFLVKGSLLIE
ncbi:MAG TPA: 3'(2'),5'-bisphosphate nucleotidase CysQ [Bacteroidia bacterium]|nr:3'(2'),5'-bisphosphate nucleotidase CysQ [Bacteroidia bacterium]